MKPLDMIQGYSHLLEVSVPHITASSIGSTLMIAYFIGFITLLIIELKALKESGRLSDICIKAINLSIKQRENYIAALNKANTHGEMLLKIQEEIILKGRTPRLVKQSKRFDLNFTKAKEDSNELKKELDKEDAALDKLNDAYDRAINKVGVLGSIATIAGIPYVFWVISQILLVANFMSPTYKESLVNIGQSVDSKFYEVIAQIIIALTIALFIGTNKIDKNKPKWWAYSAFAGGVTCAITGLTACLFVVGGGKTNIYILLYTIFCSSFLIYSSLKPLLKGKRIDRKTEITNAIEQNKALKSETLSASHQEKKLDIEKSVS